MPEVIVNFDSEFAGPDRGTYQAKACAARRADDSWEAWLEFTPLRGGTAVRTGRETTQPNRDAVLYWATGLTTTYIEGALERAVNEPLPRLGDREVDALPSYSAPAVQKPLLDPFRVHGEGPGLLRGQLEALDYDQLRAIAQSYRIADQEQLDVANRAEIISLIMIAAEKGAA